MNNMIKKITLLALLLALFSGTSTAQSGQSLGTLTLQECIDIAQEQSPVAQAARYALSASRWEFQSYRADLLPGLSITGDAPNFNKSIFSNVLDDGSVTFSSRRQSEASTTVSIDQNILQTGGRLSVSSGITRLGIFENENTYLWQSTPLVLGFQQPIFGFNSLKWRTRLEPLQYEISQKEYVEDMEGLAVMVSERFFDVLLAQINLENAEFNVARNDSIYQISQGRYNVGSIAENELLQSELALRNAEAELTRSRLEYDRSLNEFKIILGYPTSLELDITPPEQLPELDISVEQAKELAIQNNSEALNYRLSELQADRDYAQAQSESNFTATLVANYGLNQTSSEFSQLYENPENRQFITVGFEVPIFNWGKQEAQINAARNQQREVANSIEFQRRQFNQQVEYTVSQFLQLKDQVLLAAQSDTIAQRRYNVAQNRYLIGKIDITNLFIAQNEKDAARQEYIRALRDFWTGWYELRELTLYDFQDGEPIRYSTY
ncbi:TolC family protein [Aliifodinibius sp. S!AR15-10]|uniref:TolC family protein n=1 Tax=Aliifodinibius sp. S!AR15-10 TaxID=2950437 RepID=UPI002855A5E1|nr:TolC family protein [Aliifodinibius sp. S!AR15-10]MDR8391992.1 TolC family protein [Aliifodinibius sp. S!AR15-10]